MSPATAPHQVGHPARCHGGAPRRSDGARGGWTDADLASALRALIRRCGSPSLRSVSTVISHTLTPEQLDALLAGNFVLDWPRTERLVRALQGDPNSFRPLWQYAATDAVSLPPTQPTPDHPGNATPHNRLESLFAAFGPTLSTPALAFGRM
ncbi:hypothetical protein ACTWQF_10745 [Streptomyces sp. 8N114]|uniref:hypothetical protein n=1 Tax=Streptomyces sp. 8N114 TaxID=3457419 RepID=UPI003FD3A693